MPAKSCPRLLDYLLVVGARRGVFLPTGGLREHPSAPAQPSTGRLLRVHIDRQGLGPHPLWRVHELLQTVPDFIVAVKVESEFPNEYSSLGKDSIVKVKVESEFEDDPTSQAKGEAEVVKSETFQNNLLQTSQDALSYNHVKQELCDSPPTEPSKTVQLIEDFVAAVKVESTFLDQSSSFHKGLNNDSICQLKFLIDLEKTSH
uniref:uncharacterized protein isoform X2 n=1 Tax=Myxine glutinosa TaxID=7769 RepID=UPI00358F685D